MSELSWAIQISLSDPALSFSERDEGEPLATRKHPPDLQELSEFAHTKFDLI